MADPKLPSVDEWWRRFDEPGATEGPAWLSVLNEARRAGGGFDVDQSLVALRNIASQIPEGGWARAAELVRHQLEVRHGDANLLEEVATRLRYLANECGVEESRTHARSLHLRGALLVRLNRAEEAETELCDALLELRDDPIVTLQVLDTLGHALHTQGFWEEARIVLRDLITRRQAAGDILGVVISSGGLILLELDTGNFAAAELIARQALEKALQEPTVPLLSRIRILSMRITALIELGELSLAQQAARTLKDWLRGVHSRKHHLRGFACLALARVAFEQGQYENVAPWLDRAASSFSMDEHLALLHYWRAALNATPVDEAWVQKMNELCSSSDGSPEAMVRSNILAAEKLPLSRKERQAFLDRALQAAVQSNHRRLIELVDHAMTRLSPEDAADRMVRRFTGRSLHELRQTSRVDASIVFIDLVDFTLRSNDLTPDEVMSTSRSLFELAAPSLSKYRVRPLAYLGDGLLAAAEGDSHARRALRFAVEVTQRAARMTSVRFALGQRWGLDVRAGLASGQVVLGLLGSLLKLEFTAIGRTVNLASRLQSQANPREVVVLAETFIAAGELRSAEAHPETLTLKGFSTPIEVYRLILDRQGNNR